LPVEYHSLAVPSLWRGGCFAVLLELTPGDDFSLRPEADGASTHAPALPLDVLRFFLCPEAERLCLSARGGWALSRQRPRRESKA
jgi:hypothetical protein